MLSFYISIIFIAIVFQRLKSSFFKVFRDFCSFVRFWVKKYFFYTISVQKKPFLNHFTVLLLFVSSNYMFSSSTFMEKVDQPDDFLSMEMFNMNPREIKFTIIAVPPMLTNGSGIPVIGRSPTHMPMFSMKWNA